jgi:hypothetical protein
MSYEAHATTIINCFTVTVHAYTMLMLIDSCLAMVLFAAKSVPPTDCLSILFNIYFGVMMVAMVNATQTIFRGLFFWDKLKDDEPALTTLMVAPNGNAVKCTTHGIMGKEEILALILRMGIATQHLSRAMHTAESPKPAEATTASTSTPEPANATGTQTPPPCPGTPDSERSQADTEKYSDALDAQPAEPATGGKMPAKGGSAGGSN